MVPPFGRLRWCTPLNSVLPAKSLFLRNFRATRGPEQCVQCALHENHAKWALGRDRSTRDVPVSRGAATCGARTDCSGEPDQNDGGGLAGSQWGGAGSAAAQRAAQGGEAGASEIILGIDRGSLHSRRVGNAAIRILAAELRRERSDCTAISPATRAGVLRFRRVVCYRDRPSRMENGAVGALA
jgi:hypothetical protein